MPHHNRSRTLTRRRFLQGATAGALAAGLSGCGAGDDPLAGVPLPAAPTAAGPAPLNRPNFIFILTDDHRWDHAGFMGHPFLETPHLDRLAREGVAFNNAFVTTALCSPSRACFLTGQYARRHGVQNNLTPWNQDSVTFMELMAAAGYRSGFIGKWHMPGQLPRLRGVDPFITFTVQGGQGRYFDCPLIVNGEEVARPNTYVTTDLTDLALDFIGAGSDAPFSLYLSHKAAHHQFLPPPDLADRYRDADLDLLPDEYFGLQTLLDRNLWEGALGPLETHYRNYCATLTAVDREVGRLFAALEASGRLENTVIVYAGDNGYSWGEHIINGKRWATEENLRVPFIVRAPGVIAEPGRRADDLALNIDLAPTLLDLAGLPVPAGMQGRSLRPLLADEPVAWRTDFLYEYFQDFPYNVPAHDAIRSEQYLYVEYQRAFPPALFNVAGDPRTLQNIIDTEVGRSLQPELSRRLQALREAAA